MARKNAAATPMQTAEPLRFCFIFMTRRHYPAPESRSSFRYPRTKSPVEKTSRLARMIVCSVCHLKQSERSYFIASIRSSVTCNLSERWIQKTLTMPAGLFTILISLLLFACLAALGAAAERAPERVRIAVSSKSLGFLDTWAAKKRGFYRKYGLDAEIIADARPLAEPVKTVLDQQGK